MALETALQKLGNLKESFFFPSLFISAQNLAVSAVKMMLLHNIDERSSLEVCLLSKYDSCHLPLSH